MKFLRALSWIFFGFAAVAFVAALFVASKRQEPPSPQEAEAVVEYVKPFTLVDQSSRTVTLDDLKGKVWIADFVFTRCQGPCPMLTKRMKGLTDEFPQDDLRFVSFSVDPDYDRPDVLKEYAQRFDADTKRWMFLTGTREQIADVMRKSFSLGLEDAAPGQNPPDISHSVRFALVDRDGRIAGTFNADDIEGMRGLRDELRRLKP